MARIKRFYWVRSPRRDAQTRHMAATRSEGLTYCGRPVVMGWRWQTGRIRKPLPRCKDCLRSLGH
jgi:hypothetical protein